MASGIHFKEIYIHLSENEPAVVCTVRYGGLIGRSKHFSLEQEVPVDLSQESLPVVRVRNRRGDKQQSDR